LETTDIFLAAEIPLFQRPLSVTNHGSSAWALSYKIETKDDAGEDEIYFMKVGFCFKMYNLLILLIQWHIFR
jgi:hypothetical protein